VFKPGGADWDRRRHRRQRAHPRSIGRSEEASPDAPGALSRGEYEDGLEAAGFQELSVVFMHEVADGMRRRDCESGEDE